MGGVSSKIEEDKALQLCRERKKYVRQALDGRCFLAATHIAYIEALKIAGTDLRKFVEPEASIYTSTNVIPQPLALPGGKSPSQFSFSSPSISQRVDASQNIFPSPSPPTSARFHANHMKFRGTFSRKVEEIPVVPVTVSVTSNNPQSPGKPEASLSETPPVSLEAPEWDFFGLDHGHASGNHFSPKETRENATETGHYGENHGASLLEDEEQNFSSPRMVESHESDDEFDEPPTETLVRSFENVNRTTENAASEVSEAHSLKGESNLPNLSPLRRQSSGVVGNGVTTTPGRENNIENKVAPKDFLSSMKDIELLFIKASDSGREVPRMLEANKFHFRPIFPGRESGLISKTLLKSCFSCSEDPSQVPEEPPHASVKYLTWHRTTSSRSSSSRNPLGVNSADDAEDISNNLFDNFCMNSGSHASTLDRLFAWEKKLYDEVKACEMVRSIYDSRRKVLRQLESKGESSRKIDKVRAVVKDLHSRIGVAIHRINSISRKIEELRDKELQPQLEELIEGLRRMWETMLDCHKLQLHVVSIAHSPGNIKVSINSDSHRQTIINLENELISLSSSFMKWIGAQKTYVEAINTWLLKCVFFEDKSSKKKRSLLIPARKAVGPPIYVICSVWMDMFESLPTKDVVDATKSLAAEVTRFLPRHEKNQAKGANPPHHENGGDPGITPSREDASGDFIAGYDRFQTSLATFLAQLTNFAESSVKMFTHLQKATQDHKSLYARAKVMSHENSIPSHENHEMASNA
ncbi:nitrate regulatory gene2 protein-like [Ipomoea triloba]|uniref:nitrate regulatory gene2 protein-like n=1 Tax=Ipomoea triloba TaxID=35885 RepID=UPI00125E62DD|nr:nitrate regulatory gene2 protein-like [Ipomoea triloba]